MLLLICIELYCKLLAEDLIVIVPFRELFMLVNSSIKKPYTMA